MFEEMKYISRISVLTFHVCFLVINCCWCAVMRVSNTTAPVIINISTTYESSSNMSQFYNCMESHSTQSCVLDLLPINSTNFTAIGVKQTTETKEYNSSTFQCFYLMNRVNCTRMSSDCERNVTKCGSEHFQIQWTFSIEYLIDGNMTNCTNPNKCIVYSVKKANTTIEPTTTSASTTGVKVTSKENIPPTSQSKTNIRENLTNSPFISSTLISTESTITYINISDGTTPFKNTSISASTQFINTDIIIIIVVVSVCSLFLIVILVFCVCKKLRIRKETKTNQTYVNVIIDNKNSNNDDNYNNIVLPGGSEPTTISVDATVYYQNEVSPTSHISGENEDCFSNPPSTYYNLQGNDAQTDSNNLLFSNPTFNLEATNSPHYSRLGDHMKKFEHVYNCSPMDSERNLDNDKSPYCTADMSHYSTVDLSNTPMTVVQDDTVNPISTAAYTHSFIVKENEK